MMSYAADTEELLARADAGDHAAIAELLARHRGRLRQMVTVRIDPRLSARVDPSDVVQESLAEAARQLPTYLAQRPIPFYPWLRQIAWNRLVKLHQRHIETQKRSVTREVSPLPLSDQSAVQLAERLSAVEQTPSQQVLQKELFERVRTALELLAERDREVLVLWYLEQLTVNELAPILGLSVSGVKSRHRRALTRLISMLDHDVEGSSS